MMQQKTQAEKNVVTGSVCALGSEILFGMSYLFTKQAAENSREFYLLGWRFLIAFFTLSLCGRLGILKIQLKGRNLRPLLLVALVSPCIYFLGETLGITYTTASESGVFFACIPAVSLTASALILKKKPSKRQIAGIGVTLAGVLLTVSAVGAASSLSVKGYVCLTAAVLSYALYEVFVERAAGYSGGEITYVMMCAGALFFGILAAATALHRHALEEFLTLPFVNRDFRLAVLYQGMGCSVAAFFLSNVAISKIGVNKAASFIGASTVVSILSGALLLKETFTVYQMAGAAVILAGVYLANRKNPA